MATETITPTSTTDLVKLDLRPILFKMECEGERLQGEPIDPDVAERDYRRFLTLHLLYPETTLVPSALIDLVWHYHILDTRKYTADCERIFGYFLHHDPYFGIEGEDSRRENLKAWEATLVLWEKVFGEPLLGRSHRCSTKDCR